MSSQLFGPHPSPRSNARSAAHLRPPRLRAAFGPLLALSTAAIFAFASCQKIAGCEYTADCPVTAVPAGTAGSAGARAGTGGTAGITSEGGGGARAGAGGSAGSGEGGIAGTGGNTTAVGGAGTAGEGGTGGQGGTPEPEPCNAQCGLATPVCDLSTDQCVECLASNDCAGRSIGGIVTAHCKTAARLCVACLTNTHCMTAGKPRCDLGPGTCAPCQTNADCAHLDGKGVCDAGECVECTVGDESACGDNSCSPKTQECTTTARGSVDTCHPCVADSECVGNGEAEATARCVPMRFQGELREGGFCLRRLARTCELPYSFDIAAISLSGAPEEVYCGIAEDVTRCEAILDTFAGRQCATNMDCGCARSDAGEPPPCAGEGGLCRPDKVNVNRCTYACGGDPHCPDLYNCTGATPRYCR